MFKQIAITYHSDPSHGWFAVKRKFLIETGLIAQISRCSYQSQTGKTVYLEEDRDAKLLVDYCDKHKIQYQIKEGKSQDRSSVRNYPLFELSQDDLAEAIFFKQAINE